jgi:glucose-1-phosphatase
MTNRRYPVTRNSIICDVGKVIVDFSIERFRSLMQRLGARVASVEEFIEQTNLLAYERGNISSEQYLKNIEQLLPCPPHRVILQEHWQDIFTPIPEMLALLKRLKEDYRLFLLSNTNELHWQFLEERFGIVQYAHDALPSFEAGLVKPDPEIFALAEAKFGLAPESIVYIDDLPANIEAAQARGWLGILHMSYAETAAQLQKAGILVEQFQRRVAK